MVWISQRELKGPSQDVLLCRFCRLESHKENWKNHKLVGVGVRWLRESHKENWKPVIGDQNGSADDRISQRELKVTGGAALPSKFPFESHKENWKPLRPFKHLIQLLESHKENWKMCWRKSIGGRFWESHKENWKACYLRGLHRPWPIRNLIQRIESHLWSDL